MKVQYLIFVVVLFHSCQSVTVELTDQKVEKIDSLIQSWNAQGNFEGTILVAHREEIIYQKAIGLANRSWNIPMEIDARFDIASISKSMIGGLIMQLVEEKKIKLTDSITQYFDEFKGEKATNITIHHMLTHTSGIGNYEDLSEEFKANNMKLFKRQSFSRDEFTQLISELPLKFEVGEQMYYSNFAYYLLMVMIEKVEDKPFAKVFQERIALPLKMNKTLVLEDRETIIPKEVIGYNWQSNDENGNFTANQFIDPSLRIPIYGSVRDLHRWALAMIDTTFLSKSSLDLIQTNHISDINRNYGYGWAIHPENSDFGMGNLDITPAYFLHGGSMEGFRSMLTIINEGEWIIAHLSNIGSKTNELELTKSIANILVK